MATFLIQTVVCTTNVILYFAAHKGDGTKRGCGRCKCNPRPVRAGGSGGDMAPPNFGKSVNPETS